MTINEIRERLTQIRVQRNESEYAMSLALGRTKNYINNIAKGKQIDIPMISFLEICDYMQISPKDFFDDEQDNPYLLNQLINECKDMSDDNLLALIDIAKRLKR